MTVTREDCNLEWVAPKRLELTYKNERGTFKVAGGLSEAAELTEERKASVEKMCLMQLNSALERGVAMSLEEQAAQDRAD